MFFFFYFAELLTGTGPAVFKWPPVRAFITTRSALPASVYKHPSVYKGSASFTCILPCKAKRQYELIC